MYALALVQSPRLRYNCMAAPASAVLAAGMQRLVAAAPRPLRYDDWLCTLGAWLDGQLLAVASIYREPQLGPPQRGIYRFAELAVQARDANMDAAEVLIARCGAHVVRAGGRTLWVDAPVEAVALWRRCGFSIAGPASRPRGGGLQLPMVHHLRGPRLRVLCNW